jgi:hypothetical protein
VDQVAERLGLHGRPCAATCGTDGSAPPASATVRIAGDLEALTGGSADPADTVRRQRHVEVSSIVEIDAIGRSAPTRLTNGRSAANGHARRRALRVERSTTNARLKIIVSGLYQPDLLALSDPAGA